MAGIGISQLDAVHAVPQTCSPTRLGPTSSRNRPRGISRQGDGRWYAVVPDPEGGPATARTVAGPSAQSSDLHPIMEQLASEHTRGTIGDVSARYEENTEFEEKSLSRTSTSCAIFVRQRGWPLCSATHQGIEHASTTSGCSHNWRPEAARRKCASASTHGSWSFAEKGVEIHCDRILGHCATAACS